MVTQTRIARLERMVRERGEPECDYQMPTEVISVRHGEPQATDPRTCPKCGLPHLHVVTEIVIRDRADLAERMEYVGGVWRLKAGPQVGEE